MAFTGLFAPPKDAALRLAPTNFQERFLRPSGIRWKMFSPSMLVQSRNKRQSTEMELDEQELDRLNGYLFLLSAIFPDVQAEVLREMLLNTSEDSRLHIVADALIKHKAEHVRGRWRLAGSDDDGARASQAGEIPAGASPADGTDRAESDGLPAVRERFRSRAYKDAVRTALKIEFQRLPLSKLDAVLVEHNHFYTTARQALFAVLNQHSYFSMAAFFSRRRRVVTWDSTINPLIIWRPLYAALDSPFIPMARGTESAELDQEIYESIIEPAVRKVQRDQLHHDHAVALELNSAEARDHDSIYECECCFMEATFEQLSVCDQGGHLVCFRCVRHAVTEVIYGQSGTRNVDIKSGYLRCLAPSLGGSRECQGRITSDFTRRALLDERDGERTLTLFDDKLATGTIKASGLPLVRCPFCAYAEVDDRYPGTLQLLWLQRKRESLIYAVPMVGIAMGAMAPLLLIGLTALLVLVASPVVAGGSGHVRKSIKRVCRKRRGLKFICPSRRCGRGSCLSCGKEWRDVHVCYESERVAFREHMERAMVEAIKRTCPQCQLAFVKESGCNRLTCLCGYQMCYICRVEIRPDDGYGHFCQHFRPQPEDDTACTECSRCDLYRSEDDEIVVQRAAEKAEKEWRASSWNHRHHILADADIWMGDDHDDHDHHDNNHHLASLGPRVNGGDNGRHLDHHHHHHDGLVELIQRQHRRRRGWWMSTFRWTDLLDAVVGMLLMDLF